MSSPSCRGHTQDKGGEVMTGKTDLGRAGADYWEGQCRRSPRAPPTGDAPNKKNKTTIRLLHFSTASSNLASPGMWLRRRRSPAPGSPWCSAESGPCKTQGRGNTPSAGQNREDNQLLIQISFFFFFLMSVSIKVSKTFTETQSLIPDQAPVARNGGNLEQDQART